MKETPSNNKVEAIVRFGTGDFVRIGVVIGQYIDDDGKTMLLVKTPHNAIAGQLFDRVPSDRVTPASVDDLQVHAASELDNARSALNGFLDRIGVKGEKANSDICLPDQSD